MNEPIDTTDAVLVALGDFHGGISWRTMTERIIKAHRKELEANGVVECKVVKVNVEELHNSLFAVGYSVSLGDTYAIVSRLKAMTPAIEIED